MITLKTEFLDGFVSKEDYCGFSDKLQKAHTALKEKTGEGNEFLGWDSLPFDYDKNELEEVKKAAKEISDTCEILIVIGIGGSYLGAKSGLDFLKGTFYNLNAKTKIYFAGNNISGEYLKELLALCKGKEFAVNVISKSGTTTEPSIAFRFFKQLLEEQYGKEKAVKRIFATTDRENGVLKTLSDKEGYKTFVIPDDVGGRFSVLTPVGLLPLAVAGVNIDDVMKGAQKGVEDFSKLDDSNVCYQYAVWRNALLSKGKSIELQVAYDPDLKEFSEWWKQLFGESEGKDGKGIFPASVLNSTDLHSLGQFVQDGARTIFETVIQVSNPTTDLIIENEESNFDKLNFLAGKSMNEVNNTAMLGAMLAHTEGGVPNMLLQIQDKSELTYGYLVYFFERACAISAYILGVNPFNQPGVEGYKVNMFALLGKDGYEEEGKKLKQKLEKF